MNNTTNVKNTIDGLLDRVDVQSKFKALLGEKTPVFISSLLQIVKGSEKLSQCDPITILNAAATAAALDLPINPNLGFAWVVPYKGQAQFQMGWKGYVQLAHRTQQYNKINVTPIYQSQFRSYNAMTEFLDCDWTAAQSGKVVGYAAFFRLLNGFEKFEFWTAEKAESHGRKYSQSFSFSSSAWKTDFDSMAMKSLLKNILSKWGPLSVEMQTAFLADQSVQREPGVYDYIDNPHKSIDTEKEAEEKETQRILSHIEKSKTLDELARVDSMREKNESIKLAYQAKFLKIKAANEIKK